MASLAVGVLVLLAAQPTQAFRSKKGSLVTEVSVACPAVAIVDTKGDCRDAANNAKAADSCCDKFKDCQTKLQSRLGDLNLRLASYSKSCDVTNADFTVDADRNYHLADSSKVCAEKCQADPSLQEELAEFDVDHCMGFSSQLSNELGSFKMMGSIIGSLDGAFKSCNKAPTTPEPVTPRPAPCDGQVFTTVQFDAISAALHTGQLTCEPGSCDCGPNPDGFYPVDWEGKMLYPNKAGYYPTIYGYYPNADGCIPSPFSEWEYPDNNMVYPIQHHFNGQEKKPVEGGYDACGVVHEVGQWGQQK